MRKKRKNEDEELNEDIEESKKGTFSTMIGLLKESYENRPKREKGKKITKTDVFAVFLTIAIILVLGVILWFIPFTNGWIRELTIENPLFSWIGIFFK